MRAPHGLAQARNNSVENLPALVNSPYIAFARKESQKQPRESSLTLVVDDMTAASIGKGQPSASNVKASNSINLSG